MPAQPLAPLLLPVVAVALNLLVLLLCARMRFTVPRTALRCLAFAALTVVMLRAHMTPTQTPDLGASAQYRFARGAVQIVWWLLAASTTMSLVRLYYAINDRTRQERFTLDVVETVLYLTAAVAIVADVFDIPLKGVLATSGAVAIVLGLALQSTLADLFSGFVINATAPHVLKGNHDLIVVPNSAIAKSKVVNASVPAGAHATVVRFQAAPAYRPSSVVSALRLAVESCVGIDATLPVNIVTKSVEWQAIKYEASFFVANGRSTDDTPNTSVKAGPSPEWRPRPTSRRRPLRLSMTCPEPRSPHCSSGIPS
jgi:small-conductance mechanosensitive channel